MSKKPKTGEAAKNQKAGRLRHASKREKPRRAARASEENLPVSPSFAELEARSNIGAILKRMLGPFNKSDPDLWAHRTVLAIIGRVYEHVLAIKEIVPREMAELLKSLGANLLMDVNRRRMRSATGTKETELMTPEKAKEFHDQLDAVVREIYGVRVGRLENAKLPEPEAK